MSDIINIKDFYNHETRISIVENAIININKNFEQMNRYFEKYENELKESRTESRAQFRWLMTLISGLYVSGTGIIITIIIKHFQ